MRDDLIKTPDDVLGVALLEFVRSLDPAGYDNLSEVLFAVLVEGVRLYCENVDYTGSLGETLMDFHLLHNPARYTPWKARLEVTLTALRENLEVVDS